MYAIFGLVLLYSCIREHYRKRDCVRWSVHAFDACLIHLWKYCINCCHASEIDHMKQCS